MACANTFSRPPQPPTTPAWVLGYGEVSAPTPADHKPGGKVMWGQRAVRLCGAAIWLVAQQSDICRVPVKTDEQQAVLFLHRLRTHWISVRCVIAATRASPTQAACQCASPFGQQPL